MGDDLPDDDQHTSLNIMSFINEVNNYSHIHLASAKQTVDLPTEETFVKGVIKNPMDYTKSRKSQSESMVLGQDGKTPQKVLKRTPPIMDSKLRISRQAGEYPANRSADVRRTLTAEINIAGIDAFVLFDSGAETDAVSPDFVRACNIPLLELPNPMVLQMGTKGSRSCVYYGSNIDVCIHGISKSHYFDVVNIDRYDAILGAPWLNTNKAILNFKNHVVSLPSGDISTFDVLTERVIRSVGHKARLKNLTNNSSRASMKNIHRTDTNFSKFK